VPYDVRRAEPYSIYDRLDFDIPIGTRGDVYDRYLVRIAEMRESVRILKQCLRDIPSGEIFGGRKGWQVKLQKGEAYGRVENPKGALGYYIVSDGGTNPYRYHIHAPSFVNISALNTMTKGHKVADVVVILGSIDIVLGELDR
jgi:NADH-quinone oxidoreductase subunit D/NADH-quinone oxidoreductase subunit C/D